MNDLWLPHLRRDPPRHCPDWSLGRPPSWVRSLRRSRPPRMRTLGSGRSEVAGEAASCGRQDWMTGKPQSFLWSSRDPNHDGTPASCGPLNRVVRSVSQERKCLAPPSWWRTERRVRCAGLKQKWIHSNPFMSISNFTWSNCHSSSFFASHFLRDIPDKLLFHWTFKCGMQTSHTTFASRMVHHKQFTCTGSSLIDLDTNCKFSSCVHVLTAIPLRQNSENRPPEKHVLNVTTFPLDDNLIYLCLNGLYNKYCLMHIYVIYKETLQVMNNSINKKATFKSMKLLN